MLFSCSTLLLAALSLECALSQPAHHRHSHKNRRAVGDVVTATIDGKVVTWVNKYAGPGGEAAPAAAPEAPQAQAAASPATTAAEPKPKVEETSAAPASKSSDTSSDKSSASSASSSSSSSNGSSGKFGGRTEPKDNGNKDQYIGNVGLPYGSNMLKLNSADEINNFKYTNTFSNPTSEKITVIVWNKSGKDGQPQSGMSLEPNMKFEVQPNESVHVAFDDNSQVAFAQDCERDPMKGNLPNCTWGEVDFGDLRNGGWSGYDRSSIPNSAGNTGLLTISCEGAKTSSQKDNSFTSAAQTNAGGSLAPGPAHFSTTMGA